MDDVKLQVYLSMGLMKILLDTATIAVCLGVIGGCVCRVAALERRHKFSWKLLYILIAAFACGLAIDVATFASEAPSWYAVVGTFAAALHLKSTWYMWRDEPPVYMEKGHRYGDK